MDESESPEGRSMMEKMTGAFMFPFPRKPVGPDGKGGKGPAKPAAPKFHRVVKQGIRHFKGKKSHFGGWA